MRTPVLVQSEQTAQPGGGRQRCWHHARTPGAARCRRPVGAGRACSCGGNASCLGRRRNQQPARLGSWQQRFCEPGTLVGSCDCGNQVARLRRHWRQPPPCVGGWMRVSCGRVWWCLWWLVCVGGGLCMHGVWDAAPTVVVDGPAGSDAALHCMPSCVGPGAPARYQIRQPLDTGHCSTFVPPARTFTSWGLPTGCVAAFACAAVLRVAAPPALGVPSALLVQQQPAFALPAGWGGACWLPFCFPPRGTRLVACACRPSPSPRTPAVRGPARICDPSLATL